MYKFIIELIVKKPLEFFFFFAILYVKIQPYFGSRLDEAQTMTDVKSFTYISNNTKKSRWP